MTPQDIAKSNGQNPAHIWPNDWFIYENGKILGPFSADEAFAKNDTTDDGHTRLVSRKGFTQWYPIRDFSKIYSFVAPTAEGAKVEAKELGPKAKVTPTTEETVQAPEIKHTSSIQQEYLTSKGRMRLGELRSAGKIAFVTMPFTLFLYWPTWCKKVLNEAKYHLDGKYHRGLFWYQFLAMIPVFHLISAAKVARDLREMEKQNQYQATSVFLAVLYSIIPPFGIFYMQNKLNRHWLAHVKHGISKPE